MAQQKKFGAFGGVFTPAILTILGVIMYLRLPWIVGQAGLFTTIAIILIAHGISISTGLSVASIATDKKVKTGGIYYMLSRSLGLPIGGTLGLALFVGISFSVSLYIIGFTESFLSFLGYEVGKEMIQVAGTIALVAVSAITFAGAGLAIKTQYFIMAGIVLSLVAIFFGGSQPPPQAPLLDPMPGSEDFMLLFGIFFPAVTGFTAGVQMSGDLKDPNKALPLGTMLSIAVGLVIYIGLVVFFSYRVDAGVLQNNPNVLLDIALYAPFILAGIWGATLSSALGSLLGAPRILQAMSVDRITPRFFARGFGKNSEPRLALAVSFAIAEVGILIGELDVIARIVSMFFITAYGFLNLSAAIETWASPDFRPSFRVPIPISAAGALGCIVVMLLLDPLAMLGATIILGGLYLWLARRQLTLESGDTWEGVWSSVARSALHRLNAGEVHQRNWRPNIVLFSGSTDARPHLLEFGKWLVYQRGMLSNFDLVEDAGNARVITKAEQSLKDDGSQFMGVFARRVETNDVYATMEHVARFYGFSGVEPNAVLMGWARNSSHPEKLIRLFDTLTRLDFNIMLLDYDKQRGFGKRARVDIWWRGAGNNISLALGLARFLSSSDEWRHAQFRFLVVNDADTALAEIIRKNLSLTLQEYRLEGDVKVINNAVEQNAFHEIIKTESVQADLTITGIPRIPERDAPDYVRSVNAITDELGSVLLIRASSYFKEIFVGVEQTLPEKETLPEAVPLPELPELPLPDNEVLANALQRFSQELDSAAQQYYESYLQRAYGLNRSLLESFGELIERPYANLEKSIDKTDRPRLHKAFQRAQGDFLYQSQRMLARFRDESLALQKEAGAGGGAWLFLTAREITLQRDEILTVLYDRVMYRSVLGDSLRLKFLKLRRRARALSGDKPIAHKIYFRRLLQQHLFLALPGIVRERLREAGLDVFQSISNIQRSLGLVRDSLEVLGNVAAGDSVGAEELKAALERERSRVRESFDGILGIHHNRLRMAREHLFRETRDIAVAVARDAARLDVNHLLLAPGKVRAAAQPEAALQEAADRQQENQRRFLNVAVMNIALLSLQNRMHTIVVRAKSRISQDIRNNYSEKFRGLSESLQQYLDSGNDADGGGPALHFDYRRGFDENALTERLLEEIRSAGSDLSESVETLDEEVVNNIEERQFDATEAVPIALRRLVDYHLETEFIGPLQREIEALPARFDKSLDVLRDVLRLISFNINEADSDNLFRENVESVVQSGIERIERERKQIEETEQHLRDFIDRRVEKAFEQLNPYALSRSTTNLGQYTREQESRKVLSTFERVRRSLRTTLSNTVVGILYRWSTGVLVARKLRDLREQARTSVDETLNLIDAVSPKSAVLSALPFYYRHLFLGKPMITAEFWVGRRNELQQARRAVERFRNGLPGSLIIVGEPGSGKSTLAHFIARSFDREAVFQVEPPEAGSIQAEDFRKALQNAFGLRGDYNEVFNRIPAGSALLLNDVELWWERSADGFALIDTIIDLIHRFADKCFFILNANVHAFRFMNKLKRIDDAFLNVIECSPFDARDLKDILILRHRATGLSFEVEGQDEASFSDWKLARMFNRYFDYSGGNVGVALQAWVASIRDVRSSVIHMATLSAPNADVLEELTPTQTMLALQCILHKRLTRVRLQRICELDHERLMKEVNKLKTSGIMRENANGTLEIDQFLQAFLVRKFIEKGVL